MATAQVFCGTAVIAVAGTAVQLRSTGNTIKGGNIVADPTNLSYIRVGHSTVTDDNTATTAGYMLAPGKDYPIAGNTESDIWYINGKVGDRVSFAFFSS